MRKVKIIDILKELSEGKIKYAVAGGVAVVIYGYERFTKDLDLILDFSPGNIKKFTSLMKKLKFIPRVPENPENLADTKQRKKWIKEKGAKVFTFINPDNPFISVDILLEYDYEKINKKKIKFKDIKVTVVSLEELFKMKKKSRRLIDLNDIEKLKKLHEK